LFYTENGRHNGANGCVSNDDLNVLSNSDEGRKDDDDDDDDDDIEGGDDIEAQKKNCLENDPNAAAEEEPPPQNISRFDHKQKKGYIDVWWLFDDGGWQSM
jgi:hypothetical protein